MAKHRRTKTDKALDAAFHEVTHNPPAIVEHTKEKLGAARAEAQAKAIALSKARKAGARVQRRPQGSGAFTDQEIAQGYRKLG